MDWCRLHTEILGDPKLKRAARKGAEQLHLLPWLFAFAKQADDGGRLTIGKQAAEPVDLAELIPCVTQAQVRQCLRELVEIGVLAIDSDGAHRLTAWDKRQTKPSDSRSAVAERVRRHRSRQQGEGVTDRVTSGVTGNAPGNDGGNADGNAARNATEEKRGEEKRVEEKRGEQPAPAPTVLLSGSQYERVLGKLPPQYHGALQTMITSINRAAGSAALLSELEAIASGMHPPQRSWPLIGRALHDLVLAGGRCTATTIHAFCRKLADEETTGGLSEGELLARRLEQEAGVVRHVH